MLTLVFLIASQNMLTGSNFCICRYTRTIVGIGDVDPMRWPNSKWRSFKVIEKDIVNKKLWLCFNFSMMNVVKEWKAQCKLGVTILNQKDN